MRSRIRWLAVGFVVCLVAGLPALPLWPQAAKEEKPATRPEARSAGSSEPIAYMFHGSYVNAEGEVIPNPSQEAIDAFMASRVTSRDASFVPRTHQQYCAACLAEGVPEPPAFDSDKWESKGTVTDQFVSQGVLEILVYESTSPPGVCVALPRGAPGSINLMGVICQGEETGKACFWDNKDSSGDPIQKTNVREFDLTQFQNGDQLVEDCTECHRGQNVFLVHDELTAIPRRTPSERYAPIPTGNQAGGGFWSNPGRAGGASEERNLMRADGCGQAECHPSLPSTSKLYCENVLRPSIAREWMPMGGFSEGDRTELVCRDFCLLRAECAKRGAGGGMDTAAETCACADQWDELLKDIVPTDPD